LLVELSNIAYYKEYDLKPVKKMIDNAFWQTIGKDISAATSTDFSIVKADRISGGDINQSFVVYNNQQHFFIKINNADVAAMFEQEAYSLKAIHNANTIACPSVICLGSTDSLSYLVLEYLTIDRSQQSNWYQYGQELAQMHEVTVHGQFGWQEDNFIGLTPQSNQWQSNWRSFFAEQRIGWQLQLLREKSVKLGNIDHIVDACHKGLLHHKVFPSLVHGDLWQGNMGFCDGKPLIFDPASYYGDREVDIAMTELFGTLPQDFYQGYQSISAIPPGYEKRKHIYNLYHILNHANLFGEVYIDQARASITRILAFE